MLSKRELKRITKVYIVEIVHILTLLAIPYKAMVFKDLLKAFHGEREKKTVLS
jgi:hypothetical protein